MHEGGALTNRAGEFSMSLLQCEDSGRPCLWARQWVPDRHQICQRLDLGHASFLELLLFTNHSLWCFVMAIQTDEDNSVKKTQLSGVRWLCFGALFLFTRKVALLSLFLLEQKGLIYEMRLLAPGGKYWIDIENDCHYFYYIISIQISDLLSYWEKNAHNNMPLDLVSSG